MAGVNFADGLGNEIQETVQAMGFELVDLEWLPGMLIRVTIDCEAGVGVDDCERVSDQVTRLLTVEDVDFARLEVSSPGVDRPLRRVKDWIRFVGSRAHVELARPLFGEGLPEAGRRRFDGVILGIGGEPGAETVQFEIRSDKMPRTPSEAAQARRRKTAAPAEPPVRVAFALRSVERANLVAELDFRGR